MVGVVVVVIVIIIKNYPLPRHRKLDSTPYHYVLKIAPRDNPLEKYMHVKRPQYLVHMLPP